MLRSMNDLEGNAILASDGAIGHVKDFYFDDETWVIRYLVVDTGNWLLSRKVLISPMALGRPDWAEKILPVSITKQQVQDSPDIDTEKPVSRQHEVQYLGYYGYPYYWGGGGLWGNGAYPSLMMQGFEGFVTEPNGAAPETQSAYAGAQAAPAARHQHDDVHLRSCKEVMTYHIHAADGDIGHVHGMLIDEETWAVRYLIVDTSKWWLGHQVLVSPTWIKDVSWPDAAVSVNLTRQAVQDAPPYDAAMPLERQQEMAIHDHYGHPGYWASDLKR